MTRFFPFFCYFFLTNIIYTAVSVYSDARTHSQTNEQNPNLFNAFKLQTFFFFQERRKRKRHLSPGAVIYQHRVNNDIMLLHSAELLYHLLGSTPSFGISTVYLYLFSENPSLGYSFEINLDIRGILKVLRFRTLNYTEK